MILALNKAAFAAVSLEEFTEAAARRGITRVEEAAPEDSLVLNAAQEDVAMAYATAVLRGYNPRHITLRGGGPEAVYHEGRGIGALMARLALSGYNGVLALAPSSDAAVPVWRAWLNKGKNWGCGSKQQDAALVQLG